MQSARSKVYLAHNSLCFGLSNCGGFFSTCRISSLSSFGTTEGPPKRVFSRRTKPVTGAISTSVLVKVGDKGSKASKLGITAGRRRAIDQSAQDLLVAPPLPRRHHVRDLAGTELSGRPPARHARSEALTLRESHRDFGGDLGVVFHQGDVGLQRASFGRLDNFGE